MTGHIPLPPTDTPIVVSAMYKFVGLPDYEALRAPLLTMCKKHAIKGTILLAQEGLNGTVCGTHDAITALLAHFQRPAPRRYSTEIQLCRRARLSPHEGAAEAGNRHDGPA